MNRGKRLVQLAQEQITIEETDYGYESSPAPSIDVSFDISSDDSQQDPSYSPTRDYYSDNSRDEFGESIINQLEIVQEENAEILTSKVNIINDTKLETTSHLISVEQNAEIRTQKVILVNDTQLKTTSHLISEEQITDTQTPKVNIINNTTPETSSHLIAGATNFTKPKKKRTICKFCLMSVTNFERHLERNHTDHKEVQDMLSYPKKDLRRKNIISLIRNSGNFSEYLKGNVYPKYNYQTENREFFPCIRCKALLSKKYLSRHKKACIFKNRNNDSNIRESAVSQTLIACSLDQSNTLYKLRVKDEVFSRMKADEISLIAKTDNLICHFGENYLKKHKREQIIHVCSNKMRELARFLIEFRRITNNSQCTLQDIFKPTLFDIAVECAKRLGGYDQEKKTYRSPSLSAHIGTSLKQVCELLIRLILKEDASVVPIDKEQTLKDVKRFKGLLDAQWTTEISSLAFKDLNEKKWTKPQLLPLTNDIKKFQEYVTEVADKAVAALNTEPNNPEEFKNLVHASLILTILFNRKRIGDVQYTKLDTYNKPNNIVNQEECEKALSESEQVLAKHYKRLVTGGKGSRPVAILLPIKLQNYIDFFLSVRSKFNLVPQNNMFLFGCPGTEKWTRGDVVIRKFATNANLQFPEYISSNRLRKQIATVMQILNLTKEETEQFAQFMGHTEKTHNEYYKLPQDLYQTAKISKLLLLMEKGVEKYKGKTLSEIDINPKEETAEVESDNEDISHTIHSDITNIENVRSEEPAKLVRKGRSRWTTEQARLVKRFFQDHIKLQKAPKKEECLELINQYPEILQDKNWVKLKTYVYNVYRRNK